MTRQTRTGKQDSAGNNPKPTRKTRDSRVRRTPSQSAASGHPTRSMDLNTDERWRMISEAAYFHAERRGFSPGGEASDWFAAEREIETLLRKAG